jgi:hypothetical protein
LSQLHHKIFTGSDNALIVHSNTWKDPYLFFRIIGKKGKDLWENYQAGESFSLPIRDISLILGVLNGDILECSLQAEFRHTNISLTIKQESKNGISFSTEHHLLLLNAKQSALLKSLLTHIIEEKVAYKTLI